MKRLVLGSTALGGVAFILSGIAAPARAAEAVKYDIGGFNAVPQSAFDAGPGLTPEPDGFQLWMTRPPGYTAPDRTPAGANSAGIADQSASTYATYSYGGDKWGVAWGGGGSWQTRSNGAAGASDDKSSDYQTGLNLTLGNFGVGGVLEYYDQGGIDNDAYVARGGVSYGLDPWTFGVQGSHGRYDGETALSFTADPGGSRTLNRVIATGQYELAPGITLDGEVGYTWFRDTGDGVLDDPDRTHAYDIAIGSAFSF
jgi:hypothetical protein